MQGKESEIGKEMVEERIDKSIRHVHCLASLSTVS